MSHAIYVRFFFVFGVVLIRSSGSSGDTDPQFRSCVRRCVPTCDSENFPLSLKLLRWDCTGNCQYNCMRIISDDLLIATGEVRKFFGHWPYLRLGGIQEPASVVFSLANCVPHIVYIIRTFKRSEQLKHPLGTFVLLYACISLNAWIASSVFHAHKIGFAVDYDYISAFILISYGLWLSICRVILEYSDKMWSTIIVLLSFISLAGCSHRVVQMVRGDVQFGDHMELSIGLSVAHAVVWLIWIALSRASHRWQCLLCQIWFGLAAMLEIYDFPPYLGHFDAHALWHASTIPLGFLWYKFWLSDERWITLSRKKSI